MDCSLILYAVCILQFYGQPQVYTDVLDVLNIIFTTVFAMEFVFKLAAFKFKVSVYKSYLFH